MTLDNAVALTNTHEGCVNNGLKLIEFPSVEFIMILP